MKRWYLALVLLLSLVLMGAVVYADGTEMLGPPVGLTIATGTGVVAAGTGMYGAPTGTITVNVPSGVTVKQVILYWDGQNKVGNPGDDTVTVNGTYSVSGTLIGGPAYFFDTCASDCGGGCCSVESSSYRADITSLGVVGVGGNTVTIGDMGFDFANNGAGILVIYDDGVNTSEIGVRDGLDLAFINFDEPRKSTVPQTFTFSAAGAARTANLAMFVGSVHDDRSNGQTDRPNSIEVTTGGVTTVYTDLLGSLDGLYWDTLNLPVTIPAGATSLTVQVFSRADYVTTLLPASLEWVGATLSVPAPCKGVCTRTPGYWKNHAGAWPVNSLIIGGATYTKSKAIAIMQTAGSGDKCFTMFNALVSAKLNVLKGAASSCVRATIPDADAWMDRWCVNTPDFFDDGVKTVGGSSKAWKAGEPLYEKLDDYNNGLLCAPHCY